MAVLMRDRPPLDPHAKTPAELLNHAHERRLPPEWKGSYLELCLVGQPGLGSQRLRAPSLERAEGDATHLRTRECLGLEEQVQATEAHD